MDTSFQHLANEDFENHVLNSEKLTLLFFWAKWCQPCGTTESSLVSYLNKESKVLKVFQINVDENETITNKMNIKGVPTIILMQNGKELDRRIGNTSKSELDNFIAPHIS